MLENPLSNKPSEAERKTLTLAYVLYAVGVLMPLAALIAVVISHARINEVKSDFARNHHRWMMRSFWFTVLWLTLGGFLSGIGVGVILIFFAYLWYIYRVVRGGMNFLEEKTLPLPA